MVIMLPKFRGDISVLSSRVEQYWPPLPPKMEQIGCSETSGRNYHSALRNIPEERKSHLYRGGSLKSCMLGPDLRNKRL